MLPVSVGDRGDAVADVQRRLSAMGYVVGPSGVDGVFADQTSKAVRSFQQARGLPETGTVDETTWTALVEASLKLGDRLVYLRRPFFHGDDVSQLQKRLNTLGFNCGKADGIFGRITERAIRDFQKNVGIPSDGIVGEATLAAMSKLKNILETKSATSLPRKRPKPFSSAAAFKHRSVAILVTTSQAESIARAGDDVAERLKNLLELLGARVVVHAGDADVRAVGGTERADAVVGLELKGGSPGPGAFSVEAVGELSVGLGEAVYEQLASSVSEVADGGLTISDEGSQMPSAVVRMEAAAPGTDAVFLGDEAFAQKLAVAIFDGLHAFFRSGRNGS